MTARLALHPEVASRATFVVERLTAAGVDVEPAGSGGGSASLDPLGELREGSLDLAVVGLQALRGSAGDGLTTVAVLPREDPSDVLVVPVGSPRTVARLREGARVGLHGARRSAFLGLHRDDLEVVEIDRDPAADVLEASELDAVVLGLIEARALGLADRITEALDPKSWLPEPGKGALAVMARHPIAEATALDHLPTRTALRAELALLDALDVGDDPPLGSLAQPSGRWIRLWAAAAAPDADGYRLVRSDLTGPLDEPEALGAAVARQLTERGIGLVLEGAST